MTASAPAAYRVPMTTRLKRAGRRSATAALVAAALALSVAAEEPRAAGRTSLRIVYYEDVHKPEKKVVWTLRCDPVGGNHPRRTRACAELRRLGIATLRRVPDDRACAEIFGGPQMAIVSGIVGGRWVWARLRRDDACQIERWDRNWFLVPAGHG